VTCVGSPARRGGGRGTWAFLWQGDVHLCRHDMMYNGLMNSQSSTKEHVCSEDQAETECLLKVEGKCMSKDLSGQLLHGQVTSGCPLVEA
jgi:hypothetical protein